MALIAPSRLRPEDWAAVRPTRIITRRAPEPRDEKCRLPGSAQRMRPMPIHLAPAEYSFLANSPSQSHRGQEYDTPRDPEIVDMGVTNTWPRRGPLLQQASIRRVPSPSASSQYSVGQSEMSFGILDYYLGEHEPLPMPNFRLQDTPRIETPVIDPAMEAFKFDLSPPRSPSPLPVESRVHTTCMVSQDAESGAERLDDDLWQFTSPEQLRHSQDERKETYSLFPRVRTVTPPRKTSADKVEMYSDQNAPRGPAETITIVPSHQQPNASYRPRKESISSYVQSRKDSFTSFSGTNGKIQMRVLSSGSTPTPKTRSTASNSTSTASPPSQSRWSDDTGTSLGVLSTPGPRRASSGSLLGHRRESPQYPACFFEDDDDDDTCGEVAPLRRKFRWQRSSNLRQEVKDRRTGRFDGRKTFRRRIITALSCGCDVGD